MQRLPFLTLLTTLATSSNAALLFVGDFETGSVQAHADPNNGWTQFKCCQHSINVVTNPVRAGKYALRLEVRKDDPLGVNGAPGRHRAQLAKLRGAGSAFEFGQTYWVGVSIYFPKDYTIDSRDGAGLFDWHVRPDPGEGGGSLGAQAVGGDMVINNHWDSQPITTALVHQTLWQAPIEKDKWMDFVFHIKFSYKNDGILEIWKDGQKIADKKGPNHYNDKAPPYFKLDLYKGNWKSAVRKQVIYYDEIRIGDATSNYEEVAPSGSRLPAEGSPLAPTGLNITPVKSN